jgi:peptide/nickel transport system substrate-binding protein
MEPVPVQDIDRINRNANARVLAGPELRTIFLGMDQKRDELLYSNVKGKNPFKDKRVRQAFYQAIDIDGIKKHGDARRLQPHGADGGPGHQRLHADRTSACRMTRTPPRSCWPTPATPTALKSP